MPRGKLTAPMSLLTMIESKQHEALRLIAFNERRSVAELVREGIAEVLRNAPEQNRLRSRYRNRYKNCSCFT